MVKNLKPTSKGIAKGLNKSCIAATSVYFFLFNFIALCRERLLTFPTNSENKFYLKAFSMIVIVSFRDSV
jgi:hypothetical protein